MLDQLNDLWYKNTGEGKFQYVCTCINGFALILNLLAGSVGWVIWCMTFFLFSYWQTTVNHKKWLEENEPEEKEEDDGTVS